MGLSAWITGLLFSALAVGGVLGAIVVGHRRLRSLPMGRVVLGASLAEALGVLLVPLVTSPPALAIAVIVAGQLMRGAALPVANVNLVSLRQMRTPVALQGRVTASFRFMSWGLLPAGALVGGWAADVVTTRAALFVAVAVMLVPVVAIRFSPLVAIDYHPESARVGQPPTTGGVASTQ